MSDKRNWFLRFLELAGPDLWFWLVLGILVFMASAIFGPCDGVLGWS